MRYQKLYSFIITISLLLSLITTASAASNIDVTLTVEDGATVRVLHQIKNYYQEEISYSSRVGNVYTYSLPASGTGYTYRVTKPGEVTQAGYFDLTSSTTASQVIDFNEMGTPTTYEASLVTNVGAHLSKHMSVGDTFRVRSYRTWQIINTFINNIMIEPDFHYSIVSGDAITLEQSTFNSAWLDIKAVKKGISIVEMYYDPIVVKNNGTYTYYHETDANRVGRFAIIVDDGASVIDLGLSSWDSEANTVYFTGNEGKFEFTPNSDIDSLSVNGIIINADNGTYSASIKEGNNIIEATAGEDVEIAIIKGAKLTLDVTHSADIAVGSSVDVNIRGFYTPVYKMSGIYNPTAITLYYTNNSGTTVKTKLKQYASPGNITLTTTIGNIGDTTLTGGYLNSTMWGSTWGLHRGITDSGVDPNFNAQSLSGKFGQLPTLRVATLCSGGEYVLYGSTVKAYAPNGQIYVTKNTNNTLSSIDVIASSDEVEIPCFDQIFIWDSNNAPLLNKIIK